jgi:hypothetical protein
MHRRPLQNLGPAITEAGHALFLPIIGVAMLYGKVNGVAQTPANAAVAAGFIATGVLLPLDAFGLLPRRWSRVTWVLLIASIAAFVAINLF